MATAFCDSAAFPLSSIPPKIYRSSRRHQAPEFKTSSLRECWYVNDASGRHLTVVGNAHFLQQFPSRACLSYSQRRPLMTTRTSGFGEKRADSTTTKVWSSVMTSKYFLDQKLYCIQLAQTNPVSPISDQFIWIEQFQAQVICQSWPAWHFLCTHRFSIDTSFGRSITSFAGINSWWNF